MISHEIHNERPIARNGKAHVFKLQPFVFFAVLSSPVCVVDYRALTFKKDMHWY